MTGLEGEERRSLPVSSVEVEWSATSEGYGLRDRSRKVVDRQRACTA